MDVAVSLSAKSRVIRHLGVELNVHVISPQTNRPILARARRFLNFSTSHGCGILHDASVAFRRQRPNAGP